jgi:hypothetical protein
MVQRIVIIAGVASLLKNSMRYALCALLEVIQFIAF